MFLTPMKLLHVIYKVLGTSKRWLVEWDFFFHDVEVEALLVFIW